MTLNEENAKVYAMNLIKEVFSKNITTDADGKGFGGTFNRERLAKNKIDPIFNYDNIDTFVNEVLDYIKTNSPKIYKRYKTIIKDLATEYGNAKMKIGRKSAYASIVSEDTKYFNY